MLNLSILARVFESGFYKVYKSVGSGNIVEHQRKMQARSRGRGTKKLRRGGMAPKKKRQNFNPQMCQKINRRIM